jgi:hypothetical protein
MIHRHPPHVIGDYSAENTMSRRFSISQEVILGKAGRLFLQNRSLQGKPGLGRELGAFCPSWRSL